MEKDLGGFLKIYRTLFSHYLWEEEREFSKFEAWLWLMKEARYKPAPKKKLIDNKLIEWHRGQVPASLRFLKNAWSWGSTTKVRDFLSLLEEDEMIEIDKTQGQNIITLCNYSIYNSLHEEEKQIKNTGKKHPEHVENTDKTQNSKKVNKGDNLKKGNTTRESGDSAVTDTRDVEERYAFGESTKWNEEQPIDYVSFVDAFNDLYGTNLRITEKKRGNIRARLRTFTAAEIQQAWNNRLKNEWLNSKGRKYMGDWKAAMRNDEKIDNYLNQDENETIGSNGIDLKKAADDLAGVI